MTKRAEIISRAAAYVDVTNRGIAELKTFNQGIAPSAQWCPSCSGKVNGTPAARARHAQTCSRLRADVTPMTDAERAEFDASLDDPSNA